MLADSMVAVLVVAVGLTALLGSYIYGITIVGKSDRYEKAVQVAAERIELIKTAEGKTKAELDNLISKANQTQNKTVTEGNITYTVLTERQNLADNKTGDEKLSLVSVTVTWSDAQEGTMKLETYITSTD